MKICSKCKLNLTYDNFHKHKNSKDGFRSQCKSCRKEKDREYYVKSNISEKTRNKRNTDKRYLKYNKKYREENKDKISLLNKEWSRSENGKKSKKKYYQKNSKNLKEKSRNNRIKKLDYYTDYYKSKRQTDSYKEYRKEYIKKHRQKNPHIYAWRTILTNSLKRLGTKKSSSTIEMLGYSANDLKIHIESLFRDGMSWENYGEWHIDHIKPLSSFENDEDISIVNCLENLQPLWAFENLSKSNKYND